MTNFATLMKRRAKALLHNPTMIALAKDILRPFPWLDEEARVLAYRLKKANCSVTPILYQPKSEHQKCLVHDQENQLLYDVSEIAIRDVHTGIQRVVRSLLLELLKSPPIGYQVKPVRADETGQIVYANQFLSRLTSTGVTVEEDMPINVSSGDLFLCADLQVYYPFPSIQSLRFRGVTVIFVVYDILGLKLRDAFPKAFQLGFSDWFAGVLETADRVLCDSRAVANELYQWLDNHQHSRKHPLAIDWFHLGANLEASKPTIGISETDELLLKGLASQPTLLMVGTLEPRKGHTEALDALEILWADGTAINLVIIGKEGWRSHELIRRLRRHPQRQRQLYWLDKASDALLVRLYQQSSALLAASYAEGFGLPLIEAAHYGLPIIARDILIFREVAGDFVYYFVNDRNPKQLAASIRQWLKLHAEGRATPSAGMPYLTWAQAAKRVSDLLLLEKNNHYKTWRYNPAESTSPEKNQ